MKKRFDLYFNEFYHNEFILINENLQRKTLFIIFNIKIVSIYSKKRFLFKHFLSQTNQQMFFTFFIKSFFKLSNLKKHFSLLLLLFHLNQIFIFFSSSVQKSFPSNIHSTNLLRIYIEFLYSMIQMINKIKIIFSIK